MSTCPAFDVWGGYRLRCVLAAGHSGDHLASELEPVDAMTGPVQQPPPVPSVSVPVASPATTATTPVPAAAGPSVIQIEEIR